MKGNNRQELRRLDACLGELEDAHERGEFILSPQLARAVGRIAGPLMPGMSIADAMEIVFQEQERYLSTPCPEDDVDPEASHWAEEGLLVHQGVDAPQGARALPDRHPDATPLGLPPMGEAEARVLTERIRTATRHVCILLHEVHERRAWLALAYVSWEDYVRSEFNISRSRSYELLDQAKVILELRRSAGIDELPDVSAYVAMQIKARLPEIREEVRRRAAGVDRQEAARVLAEVVEDHRRLVARGRRLVRERRRAPLESARQPVLADGDNVANAIDLLSRMALAARPQELVDSLEPPHVDGVESAVRWLSDVLAAWKRRRTPSLLARSS